MCNGIQIASLWDEDCRPARLVTWPMPALVPTNIDAKRAGDHASSVVNHWGTNRQAHAEEIIVVEQKTRGHLGPPHSFAVSII